MRRLTNSLLRTAQLPLLFCLFVSSGLAADTPPAAPATGPETEKRFPPLSVPDGFKATLFACDPLVEYPSVIAIGPAPGTLFVAHDYVTGLGIEIVRRDEIRILSDTDHDGYADRSTKYAEGFNSIQGLAFHAGTVYAMHAPLLTALRDTNGDGVADERRDLLRGLGLPPEENDNRLHCANGVTIGHDGWLYLSLGDRGCDVARPEGDRLLFQEGGILRCRPDGRDLHVLSRGLRNIYDVALDEELNVFVRDNENDGGDYMIRVCHCFHGSNHGYPYLYRETPHEAMLPLADLGRGSSAGGTAYLESSFPPEFRESLYFCEWGRAVVRYPKQRAAGSFAPMREIDFAAGAATDPYGFKPTDLIVDYDGSLLISDWCDGQRPKRGRGRIYRISSTSSQPTQPTPTTNLSAASIADLVSQLNSPSSLRRVAIQDELVRRGMEGVRAVQQALVGGQLTPIARLHAVWVLTHVLHGEAIPQLLEMGARDPDPRVRAQAIRALADLSDPLLTSHRLATGPGDASLCAKLAQLARGADPQVRLEIQIALSRLYWSGGPEWLATQPVARDPALMHSGMLLLQSARNWPAVLKLLDAPSVASPDTPQSRDLALRALANQAHSDVVDGLLARLATEPVPGRRREYVDLLARVCRVPAPWTYWGFRPAPRPANPVAWEKTEAIEQAFNRLMNDPAADVRAFLVRRMVREKISISPATFVRQLKAETDPDALASLVEAVETLPAADVRAPLEDLVGNPARDERNRLAALAAFLRGFEAGSEPRLAQLAQRLDDGPVLAALLTDLGKRSAVDAASLFVPRLGSANDDVRASAVESLSRHPVPAALPRLPQLLTDRDVRVRRGAAVLAGKLQARDSIETLLKFTDDADLALRVASLESLQALREPQAVPPALRALDSAETQVAALTLLSDLGNATHRAAVSAAAEKSRSGEVLAAAVSALAHWQDAPSITAEDRTALADSIARIQGQSGVVLHWRILGPLTAPAAESIVKQLIDPSAPEPPSENWQTRIAQGMDGQLTLTAPAGVAANSVWLGTCDIRVDAPDHVEFLGSASASFSVWLNGKQVWQRPMATSFRPDSDKFEASLAPGKNRLVVQVGAKAGDGDTPFQIRFRRKSSKAEHERITQMLLEGRGNVERGREMFLKADKSLCVKCHRIGEQGGRIGPDLAGIGSRFSRIHLVESILEPSRTVPPTFATQVIALESGRVLSGVRISETATQLVLGDNQGAQHEIKKSDIDEIRTQPQSTMPEDLEKRFTDRELLDLLEFLVSQKTRAP